MLRYKTSKEINVTFGFKSLFRSIKNNLGKFLGVYGICSCAVIGRKKYTSTHKEQLWYKRKQDLRPGYRITA